MRRKRTATSVTVNQVSNVELTKRGAGTRWKSRSKKVPNSWERFFWVRAASNGGPMGTKPTNSRRAGPVSQRCWMKQFEDRCS